jgi:hypothetical protein
MSRGWTIALIVLGALLLGGCLLTVGLVIGRTSSLAANFFNPTTDALPVPGKIAPANPLFHSNFPGLGILRELRLGKRSFRMQEFRELSEDLPDVYQQGAPGDDPQGWTFDRRQGAIQAPRGLLRNLRDRLPLQSEGVAPLSVDQARKAAADFLAGLNNPDLEVGSVIVFDNHAAVFIVEKSTGIGALELLVDPATQAVFPEPGPTMRWNLKYNRVMMRTSSPDVSAEMPVSPEEAVKIAQQFLDDNLPGAKAEPNALPFYGYYTVLFTQDGELSGMLSVNGFSRQVVPHVWHGNVVEK